MDSVRGDWPWMKHDANPGRLAHLPARMNTFEIWPKSLPIRPQQLAEAGFYYTGTGDRTACFSCGLNICDWEKDDDPWTEHARFHRNCEYLFLKKGHQFVENVVPRELQEVVQPHTSTQDPSPPHERLSCKVCLSKEVQALTLPCAHLALCADCVTPLNACPVCRRYIDYTVRVYLP